VYPYWSYFTGMWPQDGRAAPDPNTGPATADNHVDEHLARQVADRIIADPTIRGGQLEIDVPNRVVILSGRIDSAAARDAAGRQAWSVPGVHDVSGPVVTCRPHPRTTISARHGEHHAST
jgi:hypothetical protein